MGLVSQIIYKKIFHSLFLQGPTPAQWRRRWERTKREEREGKVKLKDETSSIICSASNGQAMKNHSSQNCAKEQRENVKKKKKEKIPRRQTILSRCNESGGEKKSQDALDTNWQMYMQIFLNHWRSVKQELALEAASLQRCFTKKSFILFSLCWHWICTWNVTLLNNETF